MSSKTFPAIDFDVARVTKLDKCGVPAYGDRTKLVSDGFVSVQVTANYDDGNEVNQKNGKGNVCIYRPARSTLTNLSIQAVFCGMDPELYTVFTGYPAIYDPSGDVIGYDVVDDVAPLDVNLALEMWSEATDGRTACDASGEVPYGYFGLPWLSGGKVSDYTLENGAVTFGITDAHTRRNSPWGNGPYNVELDASLLPVPLITPIPAAGHQRVMRTLLAPPEATYDGLTPLDDPDAPDAVGATAGIPGHFTPIPSLRPYDLADMTGITASPTTAWTSGQGVILGDGSYAHWSATAWVAGRAS